MSLDSKFDSIDSFIQQSKDALRLGSDQISQLLHDPEVFISKQPEIFGATDISILSEISKIPL